MKNNTDIQTVAVGSRNPVKISAVRNVFSRLFPGIRVMGIEVDSSVSAMPLTAQEAIAGARQRARLARELSGADLGVGLEGGAETIDGELMTAGWAAVYNGERFGIGGGGHLPLPPAVTRKILDEGKELGTAIDELIGGENTKQKSGAIGILTRGLSSRRRAYEWIVIYALTVFISPGLYTKE